MIFVIRALVVALVVAASATAVATSINRSGGFVSVDEMAVNASSIVFVEVTAGDLRIDHVPPVLYRVRMRKEVVGTIAPDACLEGPKGLRVGSRYLAFIQSPGAQGTGEQVPACVVVPRAIEIVAAASCEEFARLDNEKIVYPQFKHHCNDHTS